MSNLKCQISNVKLSIGYLTIIIALFFYSFTQVDLGLTLARWPIWQTAQQFFQSIGYFNRPLSAVLYLIIITLLFLFYFLFLKNAEKIGNKTIWILIILTSVILTFSYNAFSYDLFNYIFDAKIVTFYNQNPYFHKALDYPGDPMLLFMHWTHRTFPYGPLWLFLTVPISFAGSQVFLFTLFLFKGLATAAFLGTTYFVGKILKNISPKNELFGVVLFALNPLVIIESLVSSHNDIVMIFFAIFALYLLLVKKNLLSLIVLLLAGAIKFATFLLVPVFLYVIYLSKKGKNVFWNKIFLVSSVILFAAVIMASIRTNFQPWYFLYLLPFLTLLGKKYYAVIPVFTVSLFGLLQYVPFLYLGNWDPPVPQILNWLNIFSAIIPAVLLFIYFKFAKSRKSI
ncbi:MAG: hypothetical protein Q8P10_01720 [bacterium]|nr:hypothetical protein [bacterium]